MANDPYICTRIITNYRGVAHVVEGLFILCLFILELFIRARNLYNVLHFIAGVYELLKGRLLLDGIILEDNSKDVRKYLVLSFIGLIIRKGFIIFVIVTMANHFGFGLFMVSIILFAIYFAYEWFMFYHVYRFYKNMDINHGNLDGLRREEIQCPSYSPISIE